MRPQERGQRPCQRLEVVRRECGEFPDQGADEAGREGLTVNTVVMPDAVGIVLLPVRGRRGQHGQEPLAPQYTEASTADEAPP
jgi:hypothetical protein